MNNRDESWNKDHYPEEWKEIKGTYGLYFISNWGNIRRIAGLYQKKSKNGKIHTISISPKEIRYTGGQIKNCDAYYSVSILGKSYLIHRLVAIAFISNPNNLPEVNHLNGDKYCNYAWNLEWCTAKRNQNHAIETGLLDITPWKIATHKCHYKPVRCIETGQEFESLETAGNYFNVNYGVISDLARHVSCYSKLLPGLHFEFINEEDRNKWVINKHRKALAHKLF